MTVGLRAAGFKERGGGRRSGRDGGATVASGERLPERLTVRRLGGPSRLALGRKLCQRVDVGLLALNSAPAALVYVDGRLETAFVLEPSPRGVAEIYAIRNPAKLDRLPLHADAGHPEPEKE